MSDLLRLAIAGEGDALDTLHTKCKGYFLAAAGGGGGGVQGGGGGVQGGGGGVDRVGSGGGDGVGAGGHVALCFAAIEPSTGHLLVGRYDATR